LVRINVPREPKPYLIQNLKLEGIRFSGLEKNVVKSMSLRDSLKKIQEIVKRRDEARREVQMAMQKATRLSKQATFLVHKGRIDEAEDMLKRAGELFMILNERAEEYPDLARMGLVDSAYQEYAEAQTFLYLVRDGSFISYEEIGVPMIPYVLGLADVIGELRRRALDSIREGRIDEAERSLELMEEIYYELTGMDEAYFLIPGLRKKCDVARRIIEATRGDVTLESRRRLLERSIRDLKDALEGKEGHG